MTATRCKGWARYAIPCRRYTTSESGFCHDHAGQQGDTMPSRYDYERQNIQAADCPCPSMFKRVAYCPDCPYRFLVDGQRRSVQPSTPVARDGSRPGAVS